MERESSARQTPALCGGRPNRASVKQLTRREQHRVLHCLASK